MKRIVLAIVLLVAAFTANAQVFRIDEFKLAAAENTFGIYANYDCREDNEFYLDMQASIETQNVQMRLQSNSLNEFVSSLRNANLVYAAWSQLAHDNQVTSVSKDIHTPFYNEDMYFSVGGSWYERRKVGLHCKFLVSEDGTCYLILQTDNDLESENMVDAHCYSEGNSFHNLTGEWSKDSETFSAKSSGAFLVFSSSDEVEMFINKIYQAAAWKSNNISQGALFR